MRKNFSGWGGEPYGTHFRRIELLPLFVHRAAHEGNGVFVLLIGGQAFRFVDRHLHFVVALSLLVDLGEASCTSHGRSCRRAAFSFRQRLRRSLAHFGEQRRADAADPLTRSSGILLNGGVGFGQGLRVLARGPERVDDLR